jgi:type IV secretion system protein VirB1
MSTMALAAFMQLAATCAPAIAPETLASIARIESGLDPLTIHVNGPDGGGRHYASATEAAADARALIAAGRSIDVGMMQINNRNFGWLGTDIEGALDPCRGIAAGAHVLAAYSAYNTGSPTRGLTTGYVHAVLASRPDGAQQAPAAPPPPTQASDPDAPPSYDVWGREDYQRPVAPPAQVPTEAIVASPVVLQSLEITENQ